MVKKSSYVGKSKCNIILLEVLLSFTECKKILTNAGLDVKSIAIGAVGLLGDLWSVMARKCAVGNCRLKLLWRKRKHKQLRWQALEVPGANFFFWVRTWRKSTIKWLQGWWKGQVKGTVGAVDTWCCSSTSLFATNIVSILMMSHKMYHCYLACICRAAHLQNECLFVKSSIVFSNASDQLSCGRLLFTSWLHSSILVLALKMLQCIVHLDLILHPPNGASFSYI